MNFDQMTRIKKRVPLNEVLVAALDIRTVPVDQEHVSTIMALLRISGKLETTPIVSEDGYVLRSRQGVHAYRSVVQEDGLRPFIDVEVLPVKVKELSEKEIALLMAWSAGFDLDPSTSARKLLSWRDQFELVKSMLRVGVSKREVRSSLPHIPAFMMEELLRKAPAAVVQEQAIAAARLVVDTGLSPKKAFLAVCLDFTNPKHVSKYDGYYGQMTKGKNLGRNGCLTDASHVIQFYERAGNTYRTRLADHVRFWNDSFQGATGNAEALSGHLIFSGQQIEFPPSLWRKLLEMEQRHLDAAQTLLTDARSRMERFTGGTLREAAAAGKS